MTNLERAVKKMQEYKAKLAQKEKEKAEKKKQREKDKKEAKRIAHKKKLKVKQNRRAYLKRRAVILEEKKKNHDKYAYYMVVIMYNHKFKRSIARRWWRNDAYEDYYNAIEKNQAEVLCPLEVREITNGGVKNGKDTYKAKYEIMIIEKITGEDDKVSKFRDGEGKFIENEIVDSDYKIIAKHDWLLEEKFIVGGYHPLKDKKDAHFILNEILLKDNCRDNIKRLFTYKRLLVIQYDTDFDYIVCKSNKEAERLYDILEKMVNKMKVGKYILFTNKLSRHMSTWMLNELEMKNGRSRKSATC